MGQRPEVGDLVCTTPGESEYVVSNILGASSASPVWELRPRYGGTQVLTPVGVDQIDAWTVKARRGEWVASF